MTPERLAEIEARANAATPGPWLSRTDGAVVDNDNYVLLLEHGDYDLFDEDMCFAAHARTDVPDLVAAIRERDALIARLKGALEKLSDGACNSRYGPGCDMACRRIADAALEGSS